MFSFVKICKRRLALPFFRKKNGLFRDFSDRLWQPILSYEGEGLVRAAFSVYNNSNF